MSKSPFDLIRSGAHPDDVLKATVMISKFELDNAAANVLDEHVVEIAMYTSTKCRAVGIQETLISGCLLSLFAAAMEAVEGRRELYDNMLEDLGLSRTQSFRCRSAWDHFGAPLLKEPLLRKFFSSESLKVLGEQRTPDAARQGALELARQGTRISIKVAKALQMKHGVKQELGERAGSSPTTTPKAATKESLSNVWSFSGNVVHVRLEATDVWESAPVSDVIHDLEAAIEEFREGGSAILMPETPAA